MIHSVLKHRCVMLRDNRSAVALIETSSANLSKNSQYCITNCELCVCFTHNEELPHRGHVYMWMWALVCRPNGPAQRVSSWDELMRGVRFEAAATDRRITSKYRESDSKASALSIGLRVLLQVQPRKWQLEKDLLCPNTLLVSLKSKRLHPKKKTPLRF